MDIKKVFFLIAGIGLIVFGYHKMGVAPEVPLKEVLKRVTEGQIAVFLGGASVVFTILRKS
ncbi:MAG TPA: hypothetical protein VN642_06445 [Dongiaceae bacterium]|nr:hypothetical protein [Dongiaceae bacterium]